MNNETSDISTTLDPKRIPQHVAIIMDGNGRWAQKRGLDRTFGHVEGVNAVHRITQVASDTGVKYLTLYAFSTENWNRPQEEVDALMHLIGTAIANETPEMIRQNVHLNLLGDIEHMPAEPRAKLYESVRATSHCDGLTLSLCLNYSGRTEIARAASLVAQKVLAGEIKPQEITPEYLTAHMYTWDMPDPDLLIRTGGEERISNFLLWQVAYSEMYFTPVLWPDFDAAEFHKALAVYQGRQRRFGLTGEQVSQTSDSLTH